MFGTPSCPHEQVLQRLVLGRLAADEAEALARHLEECDRCAATVDALAAEDTLVEAARGQAATGEAPDDEIVQGLIERLAALPATAGESRPAADPAELLAPPREAGEIGRLGPYRVLQVIGSGGMGVVFQAEDRDLKRLVALKTLKPALAASPVARRQFLREARAAAAITHDHVVTIHQVGEHRGVPFLAMQLLRGESLEQRLQRAEAGGQPLALAEVLRVGREIALGLAAAHDRGLIHRDVKPGNVWLEQDTGRVKLLDFGLSRALDEDTFPGGPWAAAGTPAYLAPEVLTGPTVDGRSDLFSLGCVLYRMLTGVTPVHGSTSRAAFDADVPQPVVELVGRLLAREPADRPQSARQVVDTLRAIEVSRGAKSVPASSSRRRLVLATGLVAVALAVLALAYLTREPAGPRQAAHDEWLQRVARLPADEQVAAVAARLTELNPDFDGVVGPRIDGGVVVELGFLTDHVADISPVRALTELEKLTCRGSESGKGILADLTPLRGMKLTYLDCSANWQLTDLTPLHDMPLRELSCWCTPVSDLGPLRGMPLTRLECNATYVWDLTPLEGMALRRLDIRTIFAPDLTPVAAMPLRELECEFRPGRDARLLRPVKSLERINGQPAEEFWEAVRARRADLQAFLKRVPHLPAEEQAPAVAAKLREYNPGFDGQVTPTLRDGAVVGLQFFADSVKDVRPLRALPRLQRLVCRARERGNGSLFDLAPLAELPLTFLDCGRTNVMDLSPLRKMRLTGLSCPETLVRDLSPLRGLALTQLDCGGTDVSDLSPLVGMPLWELTCDFRAGRDAETLRSIGTLETINGLPAQEFWNKAAAGPP